MSFLCSHLRSCKNSNHYDILTSSQIQYSSAIDCFAKVFKHEGFGAFYKGFLSYFFR